MQVCRWQDQCNTGADSAQCELLVQRGSPANQHGFLPQHFKHGFRAIAKRAPIALYLRKYVRSGHKSTVTSDSNRQCDNRTFLCSLSFDETAQMIEFAG